MICHKCNESKPDKDFPIRSDQLIDSICKECRAIRGKKYRARAARGAPKLEKRNAL